MPDHPRLTTSGSIPAIDSRSADSGWRRRDLRAICGPLCQAADMVILAMALLGIALLPQWAQHRDLLAGLLAWQVSLRNALIAAMCLGTWRVIFVSVGVYAPDRMRSLAEYVFRFAIALNSAAAVVGLVEVVVKFTSDPWRLLAIFWTASLIPMTLVRAASLIFERAARPLLRREKRGERRPRIHPGPRPRRDA